jgi:hypothetical protein
MLKSLADNADSPGFMFGILRFLAEGREEHLIDFDFDVESLVVSNPANVAEILRAVLTGGSEESLPQITETIYIVDSAHGDGGVQWVNASDAPVIRAEIADAVYTDRAIEVPLQANPYGDLVTEYWPSVRALVKSRVLQHSNATP